MKKSIILVVLAVVLVGGGALAFALTREDSNQPAVEPSNNTNNQTSQDDHDHEHHDHHEDEAGQQTATDSSTIIYTDSGFKPSSYKVKAGSTVTVKNDSSQVLEFSSDDHPAHTDNPELNMTVLRPGESGEFKPEKSGRWGFHNHENAAHTGSLVVE